MEFRELLKKLNKNPTDIRLSADAYYSDFITVEQAFKLKMIPEDYKEFLSPRCDCGSERIVNSNLSVITCCDPHCPHKIANAMAKMFQKYGVQNLGVATCLTITEWCIRNKIFEVPTHTEILRLDKQNSYPLECLLGAKWEYLTQALYVMKNTSLTFGGLISKSCVPDFDSSAEKLFAKFNCFNQLYDLYEKNNLVTAFLNAGVSSPRKILNLYYHMLTIMIAEAGRSQPLLQSGGDCRNLVITGSVAVDGKFISRDNFVKLCNDIAKLPSGKQLFIFRKSKAVQSCDYVIADFPSSSKTYTQACAREKLQRIKLIITAQQFVEILKKEVETYAIQS